MSGEVSPTSCALLNLMFRDRALTRPVSRQKISDGLRFYAFEAQKATAGPRLVGEQTQPADILQTALARRDGGLLPEAAE